jgi:hypothetical protein
MSDIKNALADMNEFLSDSDDEKTEPERVSLQAICLTKIASQPITDKSVTVVDRSESTTWGGMEKYLQIVVRLIEESEEKTKSVGAWSSTCSPIVSVSSDLKTQIEGLLKPWGTQPACIFDKIGGHQTGKFRVITDGDIGEDQRKALNAVLINKKVFFDDLEFVIISQDSKALERWTIGQPLLARAAKGKIFRCDLRKPEPEIEVIYEKNSSVATAPIQPPSEKKIRFVSGNGWMEFDAVETWERVHILKTSPLITPDEMRALRALHNNIMTASLSEQQLWNQIVTRCTSLPTEDPELDLLHTALTDLNQTLAEGKTYKPQELKVLLTRKNVIVNKIAALVRTSFWKGLVVTEMKRAEDAKLSALRHSAIMERGAKAGSYTALTIADDYNDMILQGTCDIMAADGPLFMLVNASMYTTLGYQLRNARSIDQYWRILSGISNGFSPLMVTAETLRLWGMTGDWSVNGQLVQASGSMIALPVPACPLDLNKDTDFDVAQKHHKYFTSQEKKIDDRVGVFRQLLRGLFQTVFGLDVHTSNRGQAHHGGLTHILLVFFTQLKIIKAKNETIDLCKRFMRVIANQKFPTTIWLRSFVDKMKSFEPIGKKESIEVLMFTVLFLPPSEALKTSLRIGMSKMIQNTLAKDDVNDVKTISELAHFSVGDDYKGLIPDIGEYSEDEKILTQLKKIFRKGTDKGSFTLDLQAVMISALKIREDLFVQVQKDDADSDGGSAQASI